MQNITAEKQSLLNLGKINGWIESSRKTTAIRESIAKLSFAIPYQGETPGNIEDILSNNDGNQNHARFVEVFMKHCSNNSDLIEDLQIIHKQIFSQKDGYHFYPGEWKDNKAIDDLRVAIERSNSLNSLFEATIQLSKDFHKIAPFRAGNDLIERMLLNIYLQHLGLIDTPFLIFYDSYNLKNADNWFEEKTEAIIKILHGARDLRNKYAQRTVGLNKQRRLLFEDIVPYMMKRPKFTIKELQIDYEHVRKITFQTFSQLIKDLEKANILKETTGNTRHRIFHLHEYTNLFKTIV